MAVLKCVICHEEVTDANYKKHLSTIYMSWLSMYIKKLQKWTKLQTGLIRTLPVAVAVNTYLFSLDFTNHPFSGLKSIQNST